MPGLPRPFTAASMTAAFAASTAAASAAGSAACGAQRAMVSTAMELATSPAAWPPMPSQTAKSGLWTR